MRFKGPTICWKGKSAEAIILLRSYFSKADRWNTLARGYFITNGVSFGYRLNLAIERSTKPAPSAFQPCHWTNTLNRDPMHHVLEMADLGQHRQHGLDEHAVIPFAPLAQLQVGGAPLSV